MSPLLLIIIIIERHLHVYALRKARGTDDDSISSIGFASRLAKIDKTTLSDGHW